MDTLVSFKAYTLAFKAYQEACLLYDQYMFDPTGPFEETRDHMDELNRLRLVYDDALNLNKILEKS